MGVNQKNAAHGTVPEYGAIFMLNSMTGKECIKRKIFGLPFWLGDFVLQIKSGMILFLFDFEKRELHGVFRAVSDGAMNIVPYAYSSSGQELPAQVKFSILWCCHPLSEGQFRNAIKENYFSPKKFKFGLSKVQVHRLLSLFSLKKFSDQLHSRQLSSNSFECSSDYLIDQSQSVADVNGLILNGRLQGKLMEDEDQVNTMQENDTLAHYNIRHIFSSPENSIHHSHMDNRNLIYNSGIQSNAQIMMPSLQSQSDCMTSMPFQTSVYLENITVPSVTQSPINVSCFDPNLHSLPTRELENEGCSRRSIITSEYPSHGPNYSLFPYQNEQVSARQGSPEAYYMYVPEVKEVPIQLPVDSVKISRMHSIEQTAANHEHECYGSPFDSVKISRMHSIEQTAANHEHECYGSSGSRHSDYERKGSVFSRLAYQSDTSIQEFNDYADHEKLFLDPSMDEVMPALQQRRWQWEEADNEMVSHVRNIGRDSVKKKKVKFSSSSYSNRFQVPYKLGKNIQDSMYELSTKIEDSVDDNSNHIAIGTPFVNFKRRKEPCKAEDNTATGVKNVDVGSVQLSGIQQKRRKLIRPSFVNNELRDSGDTNSGSPSLGGTSKDSLLHESASSGPVIEINKTSKLCQAAEFPDIIWLVDDEKNSGKVTTAATAEDRCGSTRNGSEDRTVFSNHISDLNITSTEENESCSSTKKCSTSEDHMASLNLNNSGLCSPQELSLEEGSELNAGNSFIRLNEGSNQCNKLVKKTKTVDEPYQGYAVPTESSGKSSTPLDLATEIVVGEVTPSLEEGSELRAVNSFIRLNEGSNKCNNLVKKTKTVDEPYQGYAVLTESSDTSSTPLDSASKSVAGEVIERRKQDNENQNE